MSVVVGVMWTNLQLTVDGELVQSLPSVVDVDIDEASVRPHLDSNQTDVDVERLIELEIYEVIERLMKTIKAHSLLY